ncbi:hypothetical protein N9906_02225 [Flavobacteriaceae bacterium]|jgi:hypothetical protein|nr:hypothetical protein [Flavobacteriaceae bacterium]MDA9780875.1 hypothetical protein [Flavobacteriaceae bacterium]MDB4298798.1 hypothetical protein [Flavobacteriaceae bacterium]MDB9912650.1 hypothetical protein [Flavobacteriaceae bacterium]
MKVFKQLFTLVIFVSLIACTSDDTPLYELNSTNLSAGSYDVTYLTRNATQTQNVNGLDIVTEDITEGETFQLTITFRENGTYLIDGQYVVNTQRTVAGEIVSQSTYIEDIDDEIGTYAANNSTMQLLLDETLFDVTLFNNNQLRLSTSNAYSEDGVDYFETSEIRMVR